LRAALSAATSEAFTVIVRRRPSTFNEIAERWDDGLSASGRSALYRTSADPSEFSMVTCAQADFTIPVASKGAAPSTIDVEWSVGTSMSTCPS